MKGKNARHPWLSSQTLVVVKYPIFIQLKDFEKERKKNSIHIRMKGKSSLRNLYTISFIACLRMRT